MRIMKDQDGVSWVCSMPKQIFVGIARMFGQTNFQVIQLRKLGK